MQKQTREAAPLVSVIMPAYNAADFLEQAVSSVISQTVSDWELLVIDDCSADETRNKVSRFAQKDPRIKLIVNEANMGVARTRNRGLDLCRGQYVALLDSDDYWRPEFLENMLAKAEQTGADIVYCSYELVDGQGKKVCRDFLVPPATSFEESIVRSVITCSTVLITGQLAKAHRFPVDVYHEDIALWFRLLKDGCVARGVTDILAAYRQRSGSRSAGKLSSAVRRWPIYRKHLGLSVGKSLVTMVRYGFYGLKKFKKL